MDFELVEQETEELSSAGNLFPRLAGARFSLKNQVIKSEIEPELSLRLSLGSCFTVEPREVRLLRSSSNVMLSAFPNEPEIPRVSAQILRTCSLPLEGDEESRKRKDIRSLERMEVKRRRAEKRSNLKPPITGAGIRDPEKEPARSAELRRSSSDFDGRGLEGSDLSSLSNSSTVTSLSDISHKLAVADPLPPRLQSLNSFQENGEVLKRVTGNLNRPKDMGRNVIDEMPCVSVKGASPHGRRIEGFLYKYRQGEELSIVCVCHGSFFTPAEFVKHAGGGDVTHPLRHIVVSPSPSIYH